MTRFPHFRPTATRELLPFGRAYARPMQPQIFGRDAEMAAIADFLTGVQRSAGALVLAGPAGSGKTTLLRAGAALAAERGYAVLKTSPARSEVRLAFAGLTDLLEGRLAGIAGDLPPPRMRALRVALLEEEAPERPTDHRLIAAAFRTALAALAATAPVLVVIDDVQWLDQPSESAVGFALRRMEDEPVGLICAQRTERLGAELPLELDRARQATALLPVGALSLGALRRLLRTRLGTSFSQSALRRIEAQSGGNPFIALELGRALARRGVTSPGNAVMPVPETLSGLVDERLRELQPVVIEAVRLVAVMPDAPIEQYVTAGACVADLDAAVVAGVLELDGGRVRFSHPLLASAIANAIPPGQLRELHAIASRLAQLPEARARHRAFAASGPSAAVAADLDDAALAAAAQGAPAAAAELFELAASLTPEPHAADAARRHLGTAQQLDTAGETRAARATLRNLIGSSPPGPFRAAALSRLGSLSEEDIPAGTELLRQALAEAGGDPALTASIHCRLSVNWMVQGDTERSQAEARQAVADAERTDQPALLSACLAQAFTADCQRGAEDERELDRALELERAVRSVPEGLSAAHLAGVHYFQQGRLDEADAMLRQCLARAESDGFEDRRADILLRLSRVAGRRGDARLAAELAANGLEIAEQLDLPRGIVSLLYGCASAALLLGQAGKVRDAVRRGLELAQRTGDKPYVVCHQAMLGSLDLALGDYPAAAARFGPLARTLPEIGWHPTTQSIAPDVAEALIAAGELDQAAAFLAEVERGMRDPLTQALMARCRGLLAAGRGDLGLAVKELTGALELHRLISPHPLDQGRTLLVLGSVQRRLRLRGTARTTLSEALGVFERISAPLWAAQARGELARISGRSPGPAELTATELRVAELVASGRSNKEAAAELFVSVRAIESTLTKAYAKLGVRSRTELAARLHATAAGPQPPACS